MTEQIDTVTIGDTFVALTKLLVVALSLGLAFGIVIEKLVRKGSV